MVDLTVLGAGVFGLSIAFACQQRGASVRVIDPHGIGAGSSGGIVGALAPHTPENWNEKKAFQFDSLHRAERFWTTVEQVGGRSSGYARTGRLQPIADARGLELAKARAHTAEDLWQGLYHWQIIPAEHAPDWAPRSLTGFLIRDTLTARVHPRQACAALAAAIKAQGGEICTQAALSGLVIEATGWRGLLDMSEAMGQPVGNGVKGQAVLLDYDARDQPQLFADGLHIVPHADGTVAIGSTSERDFTDPATTDTALDDVLTRALKAFPMLKHAAVLERWAGVRPRAKSRAPMLGRHPVRHAHFVANGGFKIGFGMAPKIADVMADLMLDGRDTIPEALRVSASLRQRA